MAIKFVTQCKVCKKIRAEEASGTSKLIKRIYNSRQYVKGGESLKSIAKDYQKDFQYQTLYKHSRMHQAATEDDLTTARLNRIHKTTVNAQIDKLVRHQDVRQEIMSRGMEQIESGEIKLNANAVLSAANKEADIESKQKDQAIELMKMVQAFQSGELQYAPPPVISDGGGNAQD